jgi:hypothetical protein
LGAFAELRGGAQQRLTRRTMREDFSPSGGAGHGVTRSFGQMFSSSSVFSVVKISFFLCALV